MKKTGTLTKIVAAIILVCMLTALTSCLGGMGGLKVEKFTVDRNSVVTDYYIGDEIDFSGIKIHVSYSDETLNTVYTHENAKIDILFDSDITATTGTKSVKVSMKDPQTSEIKTATVRINVTEDPDAVKFSRYELDCSEMKTSYEVGDAIDFSGIKVYEVFTDGSKNLLTDLTKLSYDYDPDTFTATENPNKIIPVMYNGVDAGSISIKITDPESDTVEITSIEVGGSYKTTYEVGEAVDFTGLFVTVTYVNETVETIQLEDLEIAAVSTSQTGIKTVVAKFTDPVNGNEANASFEINIINKRNTVIRFEKPASIALFDDDNKTEGKPAYGDTGFYGSFIKGGMTYKVGDDNAFKFSPSFAITDGTVVTPLSSYFTTVELSVYVTDAYAALTPVANGSSVSYYQDETLMAVVNTFTGEYDFSESAVGNKFKLSVLPSADYYIFSGNAVSFEVEVIDAYNIYEAAELAVVDNYNSEWTSFKEENGLAGISPNGIVIHDDIHITASDVPISFFYITTSSTVYTNPISGETRTVPAGTRYIKDIMDVYHHVSDLNFAVEGNFFTVSAAGFPLVASPAVAAVTNEKKDYGEDFSNTSLFKFESSTGDNWFDAPDSIPTVTVNNLEFIGNAARNNWIDADKALVSAGGLIFMKSTAHTVTRMDNTICNSYFISYFPEYSGSMYVTDSKCYDSYQNAAFVFARSTLDIQNSYISNAGGPLIIANSVPETFDIGEGATEERRFNPIVNVTNTKLESSLTGTELWFSAVQATTLVGQIKALNANLNKVPIQGGSTTVDLGNFVMGSGENSTMNIYALLMNNGANAEAAVGNPEAEGTMLFDGKGIERWITENPIWGSIVTNDMYLAGAPCFIVGDGSSPEQILFYVESPDYTGLLTATGIPLAFAGLTGQPQDIVNQADIIAAFQGADTITLCRGGMSVVFKFSH